MCFRFGLSTADRSVDNFNLTSACSGVTKSNGGWSLRGTGNGSNVKGRGHMVPSQRRNRVALLITAVLLTGCAEAPYAIEPASEHAVVSATTAHAHQLARSVAISLQDGNARFDLYRRMQNSEAAEGKVFLSSYLRSSGLDTAISRQGVNFVDLADNLPALEMYLPVPTHRKQWQGSEDLLVLAVTSERDPLLAYDVHGKPRLLSLDAPPAIPVLVIVPAESFDANGVIRARSRRAQSATPAVIALDHCTPEMITCDHEGDVGWLLPEGALSHRGIGVREWISHVKTPNDHEPWILGAPEFTLFVAGTSPSSPMKLIFQMTYGAGRMTQRMQTGMLSHRGCR